MIRRRVKVAVAAGSVFIAVGLTATVQARTSVESAKALTPKNVAYLKGVVKKYSPIPKFTLRAPAFNASAARGKSVFEIPVNSAVPFSNTILDGSKSAAAKFGLKITIVPNQGQTSEWVQGVNQAIAQHADALVLSGINARLIGPQLQQAQKAGIKVIASRSTDTSQHGLPPATNAVMPAPFGPAMRIVADWIILKTQGKANVLFVQNADWPTAPVIVSSVKNEFSKRCPSCKLTVVNVPLSEWATKTQSTVQSALVNDPKINYVVPMFDGMSQWAAPAIEAAHRTGKVHIATFNGSPFVLKMLATGKIVNMDLGESQTWIGWADIDQTLRVLAGKKPLPQENTALRIFTKANISQAGPPFTYTRGYGKAFATGYGKLWGK